MSNTQVSAYLENWSAWSPGIETREQWKEWAEGSENAMTDSTDAPKLKFLPAMFRRRMSQLCKSSLQVAYDCLDGKTDVPSVFASRHGEMHRLVNLLNSILLNDDVSPAAFSSSVHNAAAGLFSIANKNAQPSSSIAAGPSTLPLAFLDAVAVMHRGNHDRVLLVVVDEHIHETYRPIMDEVAPPLALALLLAKHGEKLLTMTRDNTKSSASRKEERRVAAFLKWLASGGEEDYVLGDRLFDTIWSFDDSCATVPA